MLKSIAPKAFWYACCRMQAVDSESGGVADEATLRKPPGWRDNPNGRLRTIALFHANYTPVRTTGFHTMHSSAPVAPAHACQTSL